MKKRKPPSLADWINSYGAQRLAMDLGLRGPSTPYKWAQGTRKPGILMAEAIQEIAAKDGVTFTISYLMGGKK